MIRNKYEFIANAHIRGGKRFFTEKERIAFREGALFVLKRLNFDEDGNLC